MNGWFPLSLLEDWGVLEGRLLITTQLLWSWWSLCLIVHKLSNHNILFLPTNIDIGSHIINWSTCTSDSFVQENNFYALAGLTSIVPWLIRGPVCLMILIILHWPRAFCWIWADVLARCQTVRFHLSIQELMDQLFCHHSVWYMIRSEPSCTCDTN